MNFDLKVRDVIKETFLLTGKINDKNILNNLINFVKKNKDENLSHKTNVTGHFTGFHSLIDNKDFHNFLKIIQREIKMIYQNNFIIQEAWGNICKIKEEVLEHEHIGTTAFCGILYLSEGGPGTYFRDYDITVEEEIGKFVLFSPMLKHSVKAVEKDIERITIAFNMNEVKSWDNGKNFNWIT